MTKHTDDSERPQPLGLPLNDLLGPLLDKWAADEYVQFVSRSGGQRTTATVSRDALRVLAERAAAAERELCAQHWASQVEAVRERADVSTRALFTMRHRLDEAAKEWARTANGFPVAQSLRILADDCNKAWHAAIAAQPERTYSRAELLTALAARWANSRARFGANRQAVPDQKRHNAEFRGRGPAGG